MILLCELGVRPAYPPANGWQAIGLQVIQAPKLLDVGVSIAIQPTGRLAAYSPPIAPRPALAYHYLTD